MSPLSRLAGVELPEVLDLGVYRERNPDIAVFSDNELQLHYARYGRDEGREANAIITRADFAGLVAESADTLEIGPFYSPMLKSECTKYFDVLPQEELLARARTIGIAEPRVPKIDFISENGDLSQIGETFDAVLSSHCIEHQPDLIAHLRQVRALLRDGGRYFLLIPDKRYCFDHFIPASTVADVMDAHHLPARVHSLRNVIHHRAFTCHNEGPRHWAGDHGTYLADHAQRVGGAIAEYQAHAGAYIDVHAWFFTPDSLTEMLTTLKALGLIDFTIDRLYPTRRNSIEFWMVLRA